MDVLSDAIAAMRTGEPSSNRLRIGSPWCYSFAAYDGAGFHVLLRGTGWVIPERGEPLPLGTGDIVLLPHGSAHVLSGSPRVRNAVPFETAVADPSGEVDALCGKYRLDRSRAHPLLAELPEIIRLPAHVGRHPELRAAIDLLGGEVNHDRPGRNAAVSGLLDLLLVYAVRAWLDDSAAETGAEAEAGWPRALHDPRIAAALEHLHTDPARPWRIEDLARSVGLSRATLARRFTTLTGQSPMAYLTWWRMTTAARLLRDTDLPLPSVAAQVGYASPYAFSHAFKRHSGLPPAHYRSATTERADDYIKRSEGGALL